MAKFTAAVKQFARAEEGATMVEYALMVALIAVACIAAVQLLGTGIKNKFGDVNTALGAAK